MLSVPAVADIVEGASGAFTSAAIASIGVTDCSADHEDVNPSSVIYLIFTYLRVYTVFFIIAGLAPLKTKSNSVGSPAPQEVPLS